MNSTTTRPVSSRNDNETAMNERRQRTTSIRRTWVSSSWTASLVVVVVLLLLTNNRIHNTLGFTLPTTKVAVVAKVKSSRRLLFQLGSSKNNDNARAGTDGYSLMRQPVVWNPDEDPEFEMPTSLDQSRLSPSLLDDTDWWSNKQQQKQQTTKKTKNSNSNSASSSSFSRKRSSSSLLDDAADEAAELDLFRRSLETLDYGRVMKALERECTTIPAREMVQRALDTVPTTTKQKQEDESIMNEKKKLRKMKQERANQPLTADTVEGSQERYQAVREMMWLLLMNDDAYYNTMNDDEYVDKSQYTWKNRLGYSIPLFGRPTPTAGSSFPLKMILASAQEEQRVLEGDEILMIADMMNILEDITLWNENGLKRFAVKKDDSNGASSSDNMQFVELPKLADCITVNTTLQELLHNAFEEDNDKNEKGGSRKKGGGGGTSRRRLSGRTFPKIGQLRARVRSLKADIMDTLNTLVTLPSIKSKLALESGGAIISEVGKGGDGRLVLPVAEKYASSIGIVHDTSRSGKTVYVEPTEIVGPTNQLRQAESELRQEEARIWRLLTEQILKNQRDLELAVAAVGQLDLVLARTLLGQKLNNAQIPIVENEGIITLRNAQHPVLLLRDNVQVVVGNDIQFGEGKNQGLVLTGPNAGGKTLFMKLMGLVALMARSGIPVPADPAQRVNGGGEDENTNLYRPRVDFFNPVLADIGDLQSVGDDLSTFSGHMLVCREVLNNSGKNALVLMDELGSGTDPAQGVAIAQALLEALLETGARVAITTHYMQLKQLAASDDRFAVAGMQFVNGRPTYKLLPGTVGESFALAVAERLNLPQSVIDRATELLDSETRQMGDLLREMEDQKALVDQQAAALEEKRKELAAMEFKMREEQIRMEKKQLNARRDEARKFAKQLEEKEEVLEGILEKLKADPSRRVIAKSWDDIKFVRRDALNEAENIPSVLARKQKAEAALEEAQAELVPIAEMRAKPELKAGDKLIVCKKGPLFGREGDIIKTLGGRVEVRVNGMSVTLKLTQVALPVKGNKAALFAPKTNFAAGRNKGKSISKAAEKAIAAENSAKPDQKAVVDKPSGGGVSIRTQSNTVDVRGCNLMEAQEKIKQKISSSLMNNRSVVFVLHGHGTGGVLKNKIRAWLKQERKLVKQFNPADVSDGGDAVTRLEV